MSDDVRGHELDVLRCHRDQPRSESGNLDLQDAQIWLTMAAYLVRGENGEFSIAYKGLKYLREAK
jgi:hypothetical protein